MQTRETTHFVKMMKTRNQDAPLQETFHSLDESQMKRLREIDPFIADEAEATGVVIQLKYWILPKTFDQLITKVILAVEREKLRHVPVELLRECRFILGVGRYHVDMRPSYWRGYRGFQMGIGAVYW